MRRAVPLALLLVGACAGPKLVLLPDETGGQGAVAVLESRGKPTGVVVANGNTRTDLRGRPTTRTIAPERLTAAERAVIGGLPPPPKTFILHFEEGTTRLTPDSLPELEKLRAEVAQRSGVEVQVTGYTDTLGSDADNDRLSQQRADEVKAFLGSRGFDMAQITAIGRGERDLRVPTPDGTRNAQNRRVEVTVR